MKALVLSGGSIKGAFQAGAQRVVLECGFAPDYVWGVSVGALNGAFLADRAGRAVLHGEAPDWPQIGRDLKQFWLEKITRPSAIVRRRSGGASPGTRCWAGSTASWTSGRCAR